LHLLIATGGLVSFGHAASFGLGAYGAALAVKQLGLGMGLAIAAAPLLALAGAIVVGWFAIRLSGVYFAMLTLAFAQIIWSIAFQWSSVTGGDNGLIGLWPDGWAAKPSHYYWLVLMIVAAALFALRVVVFSPFGYALRALRDSALRSEAIGLKRQPLQWFAFALAGAFAGLAGGLYIFLKGSVFPDSLGIGVSVDALVMSLLGGIGTISGGLVGAAAYKTLSIWLISQTDYSKLVLGTLIVALVLAFPQGIVGAIEGARARLTRSSAA